MFAQLLPYLVVLPPLIYSLLALTCAQRYFAAEVERLRWAASLPVADLPPITIFKPVKGMDAGSYANFASFCTQEYPTFQLLFAVADDADPVVAIIRQLQADFPQVAIDLVVNPALHGPNYKVGNLINAYPAAKHDLLIICDSDIRVGAGYLRAVAAPFVDPAVGLVTSLYRSPGVSGAATAVEALGFSTEMIPNVLVALRLEGLSFALGASMAVRREALASIGGLPSLVNYLADDYQLGNQIHRAGWGLVLSGHFVESVMHRESLATVLSRQLRWARTMRVSRPGGYLASGITQPFPAALLALLLGGCSWAGIGAAALLYLVRGAMTTTVSRLYVQDGLLPRYLWLLPLRDALAFGTWALAFLGQRVTWRGHHFNVLPGGKLEELREP